MLVVVHVVIALVRKVKQAIIKNNYLTGAVNARM